MQKTFYIIPGWEDAPSDSAYILLAHAAREKGYEVVGHVVDWKRPLSEQIFAVPESAVIFGFSLGALLARLIAQKYPCEHLILASVTPDHNFSNPEIKKALIELTGKEFIDDLTSNLTPTNRARKQTIIYGALEEEPGDILVPNTEHELNNIYIEAIAKIL